MSKSSAVLLSSSTRVTYRRLLRYAWPYRGRLALGVFCGLVFGGSAFGLLGALQKNLDFMFEPRAMQPLVVIGLAALLPLVALIRGAGDFASRYLVEWVGNRVVADVRSHLFRHIHNLSLQYFTSSRSGDLISRATTDSMMVQRAVSQVVGDMAREPFVLVAAVSYLVWLDARLALFSLVLFPICIVPVAIYGRKVRRAAREGQERMADVVSILHESITGVRVVKAFGMEAYECRRFDSQNQALFRRLMRVVRSNASIEPIIVFISFVGLSLVLLYARHTGMTQAQLLTFAAALVMMYQPAKKISRLSLHIQQSCAAADRIFEILDTPIQVREQPAARALVPPIHTVTFEQVQFAYEAQPVLRDISFTVRTGEILALVGSSGSGKTTLISLLPRFFDVTGGRILINGQDIRELTLASLRGAIGLVSQETVLFNDSVAHNIAYGRADTPREEIETAARRAHAHDFITALPQGYETVIGEQGVRLSGGQRQRLSIARAMLRNPPLLILDEATSALDTESERHVQAALADLMQDRTVFAIAHRLSTIAHADRILVLGEGRVVEEGTHEQLIARNGQYRYLYDLQFSDQEPSSTL
ncbi:MAG: ABC transporter ATP-binding protein/permease [Candidatus Marinimicrobia bacterium]|nr:ABC transporter ATP-binding protein/permease [Candidatus Neomarinimicrobiota bacterium]